MRVHRLHLVHVDVAQAHVIRKVPIARESLEVAAVFRVVGVLFHQTEDGDRFVERARFAGGAGIAGGAVVFRQCIDPERLPVNLLARLDRRPVHRDHPGEAAIGFVPEARQEIVVGPPGHLQVLRRVVALVGGRVRPQDAGAEQRATRRVCVHVQRVGNLAVEAAARFVHRVFDPEREDIFAQLGFRFAKIGLPRCFVNHL